MMFQKRLPLADELVVDNFAGGGGASIGIERGIGRAIDVAINHDPVAIAMHQANHPNTVHYAESVWDVDPLEACKGPVGLAWFSPDCTHFSRARGGVPVKKQIRGLAWVVLRWAATVKPRVIMLENVPEFAQWGPLTRKRGRTKHPRPCKFRTGSTFEQWRAQLEALGYETDTRELVACDYGAPTIRKRFFLIARRDGLPIVWPEPTHGPGLLPFRTAAECIDWSIPCPSIFERKRPLAEATMRRIAVGIKRYVLDSPQPFIVPICHTKGGNQPSPLSEPLRTITTARGGEMALVAPSLIQTGYGERRGQAPRSLNLGKPLGTVVAGGSKHGLVATFLAKHFGGNESPGWPLDKPISTVTSVDHHAIVSSHLVHLRRNCAARSVEDPAPTLTAGGNHLGEVRAFLLKYYGTAIGTPLGEPMHSTTSKGRFGLVTVHGEDYQIVDIGMRMLQPRELFNAQGFPSEYDIDVTMAQKPLTKAQKIKLCGNSVPPQWSEALVRANFAHERVNEAVA